MSRIDLDKLSAAISEDAPCGTDYSFNPAFQEMERASIVKRGQEFGKVSTQDEEPNWQLVFEKAVEVLNNSKDLRAAVFLTQSALHIDGFLGLADGLALINSLIDSYWDSVYPLLDPDDNNDPTERINCLVSLLDIEKVLNQVRRSVLVNSKLFGAFSLRDIEVATGKLAVQAQDESPVPELSAINAAFQEVKIEVLENTISAVSRALDNTKAIESSLEKHVNLDQTINLQPLSELLLEAKKTMTEYLENRPEAGVSATQPDTSDAVASPGAPAKSISGVVNSREDVIRAIDSACEYYARYEPSSPVPMLLKRAKSLVNKDFMEIIRDLTPAGVTQAEQVTGVPEKQ